MTPDRNPWAWARPLFIIGAALIVAGLGAVGCGPAPDPWAATPGSPRVVVTFAPLACFVRNVGGDDVAVLALATANGPHHYEPTFEETVKLRKADLFFVNGLELDERFADRMARSSNNPRLQGADPVGYVRIGERLLRQKGLVDKMAGHHGHDHHGHDHGHHHGEYDPHLWLGIPQAKAMVEVIRDELKKANPAGTADYDRRAADFQGRLDRLLDEGRALLKGKKDRSLVTNHDSLHYFARSFDLKVAGVIQLQAGTDVDSAGLARLIETCKEQQVRVIATEPQFQQRGTAARVREELQRRGVNDPVIIEIDPLETASEEELRDPSWYEKKMRANLEALAGALR